MCEMQELIGKTIKFQHPYKGEVVLKVTDVRTVAQIPWLGGTVMEIEHGTPGLGLSMQGFDYPYEVVA